MSKEKHSNKQKGKKNPKLEEAVRKWPKGFSLWE